MRKLTDLTSKSNTCLLFGSPETTTGGRPLKFYASIRIDIPRIAAIQEGEKHIGNRTCVKIVKNKLAAPFQTAEFDIDYGLGITKEGEIIDQGKEHKIIDKSGA